MNMKRIIVIAPLVLLLCALLCGFVRPGQEPTVTLQDMERETKVDLYEVDMGDNGDFFVYVNERFGYSVLIPPAMAEVAIAIPDNGDGLILASKDGSAQFRVSGGLAEFVEAGAQGAFDKALNDIEPGSKLYEALFSGQEHLWHIFWIEGSTLYKRKFIIQGDYMFDCQLSYPASEREKYDNKTNTVIVNSGFLSE